MVFNLGIITATKLKNELLNFFGIWIKSSLRDFHESFTNRVSVFDLYW